MTATSLCSEEEEDVTHPLPNYDLWCGPNSTLNVIPFFGGMTNALKFVLLGALMSLEEGRCFFVSEKNAHLNPGYRKQHTQSGEDGFFVNHFFELIGLPHHHPFVVKAIAEGRTETRMWGEYWNDMRSRHVEREIYNYTSGDSKDAAVKAMGYDITSGIDGHTLKRDFLRRMWHLRPYYRNETCHSLREHNILPYQGDFIAYSVRRGDKDTEGFKFPKMREYIHETERVLPGMYPNVTDPIPNIFVATDDCSVMKRLQELKPTWNFQSQCYNATEEDDIQDGYDIKHIPDWSYQQREAHFKKFFVELYALSLSKVYIGVAYTNVAWFSYFLRPKMDKTMFILLDQQKAGYNNVHDW